MGFRFRRSIKIAPGIRLNVSKSGLSASVGRPGATVNISNRGTRATVGIPGTGISYSEKLDLPAEDHAASGSGAKNLLIGIAFIAALCAIAFAISNF